MRKMAGLVLVLAVPSLAMVQQDTNSPGGDKAAIEKAVLDAHARMTRAGSSLDADAFFAFILDSDTGSIIQDGKLFKTRVEALGAVKAGFQGVAKADRQYDRTYVTVLSPEAALLVASGSSTVTLGDGRAFSGPFAVSLVFVLRDGQWKVLHGHYSIPNGPS
jgi:hypothetical protein